VLTRRLEILPAIDVLGGRAVRLAGGKREAVTLEGGDPVELATRLAAEGAERLHLVDLDGAFSGVPSVALVERVCAAGGVPLQVGGGYRSPEAIAAALDAGAERVMVGTAALTPGFVEDAVARFGQALVVAVDVRDGRVAVEGWTQVSELTPGDLEAEYGLTGGHPLHAEPALDSFFLWRPLLGWSRYRMPVSGLYLAGSGAHPGGGVTGAPGRNAAHEVIADRKRRR